MANSEVVTREDLSNILSALGANTESKIKFVYPINATSSAGTANTWTYTGLSFTVPKGHVYIVNLSQGYTSGAPKGIGLHIDSSLHPVPGTWDERTAPNFASYTENGVEQLTCLLDGTSAARTYFVFTYRASTVMSGYTNKYYVYGLDFNISG